MPQFPDLVSNAAERLRHRFDEKPISSLTDAFGERRSWALVGATLSGFAAGIVLLSGRKLAMQATTALAGDWFAQLKLEHRQVEALFKAVHLTTDKDVGKRTALLAHIAYALLKHAVQEETVIYPTLREVQDETASKHLAAEHFDIKTYLHELSEMKKDDPNWIETLTALESLVSEHVKEEEERLYPLLHSRLSEEANDHLTRAMNREGIKLA